MRSHREGSPNFLWSRKDPATRESKKQKNKSKMKKSNIHKNLTLNEIKAMFPDMHTKDALDKLASLRRGE